MFATPSSNKGAETVRGFLAILWRNKFMFLIGLVLSGASVPVLYYLLPKSYTSNCQLLLTKKRPERIGFDIRETPDDYVVTHQGLLKSQLTVERAIRLGKLDERPGLFEDGKTLAETILKKFTVTRQKDSMGIGSNILLLSYRASNPDDANAVLNALVEAYQATVDEIYVRSTEDTRSMFEQASGELHKELHDQAMAYQKFRKDAPLLWKGKDGIDPHQERLTNYENRRVTLLQRQAELQSQLATLRKARNDGVQRETLLSMAADYAPRPETESARQNQSSRWQEQVLTLIQQEKKLLERYGPDHPEVVSVRLSLAKAREFVRQPAVAALEETKDKSTDIGSDPVELRLESLQQEVAQLQKTIEVFDQLCAQERKEAREISRFAVEDDSYRSEMQRNQQLFDALLRRLQDANLVKDAGGFESRMLAPPGSDGVKQVQPNIVVLSSVAAVVGLVLGLGLALVGESRETRYRSAEQVRGHLGLRVLGEVPRFRVQTGNPGNFLITGDAATSPFTDVFRRIRTTLLASTQECDARVLLITSPGHGEGKTLLAANLAVVLSQAGKRVVLVDAHGSAPRIAQLFCLTNSNSVVSALHVDARCAGALVASAIPGLTFLAPETPVDGAADVIASAPYADLLRQLRGQFDHVLLDGPPLLAGADGLMLATLADATVLVVDKIRTKRADAERAVVDLDRNNSKVLGVVFNESAPLAPLFPPRAW